MSDTPMRKQIVRFSPEDRGNVSNEDWKRLLDAGFIPVFVKNLPTIVANPAADSDALREVATGGCAEFKSGGYITEHSTSATGGSVATSWCAECKGSGYIITHSKDSATSGNVTTRKCGCGGRPFTTNTMGYSALRNAIAALAVQP